MSRTTEISADNRRFDEIVARFLNDRENGLARNWRDLVDEHPDLAGDLHRFFAGEDRLHGLAGPLKPGPSDPTPTVVRDSAPPLTLPSLRFGDYELVKELARGGMGVVYQARQLSLNRDVALKMILAGTHASAEDLKRFRNEAEAAAQLNHPNIVPIFEVGEHGGSHYFSMKLINGGSLADHVEALRQDRRAAAKLVAQVARAVQYGHDCGVLHRDLKPANVLLESRERQPLNMMVPYVADFGLAKRLEGDSSLTQSGAIVGTPSYMAPEQAAGKKDIGRAADVYSLGAILYHVLTGRKPFQAESPMATVIEVQTKTPPSPRSLDRSIDQDLETICLTCLDKTPQHRYHSAQLLAEDLERWLRGDPIHARPPALFERAWRWLRRHPMTILLGSIACFTIAIAIGLAAWSNEAAHQAAQNKRIADQIIEQREKDKERKAKELADQQEKERQDRQKRLEEEKAKRKPKGTPP